MKPTTDILLGPFFNFLGSFMCGLSLFVQVKTSRYVFECLLPRTQSLATTMLAPISAVTDLHKDNFSFDYAR